MTVKQFIRLPRQSYKLHGCFLISDGMIAQKKNPHPGMMVFYFKNTKIGKKSRSCTLVKDVLTKGRG